MDRAQGESVVLPLFKVNMSPKAGDAVKAVLDSGMIGEGPRTEEFTLELCNLFGNPYTIALNSCTSALTLAMRLCVTPEQGVVSSSFTFPATNCAIATRTKKIYWGKLDTYTLALDPIETVDLVRKHADISAVVLTLVAGIVPPRLDHLKIILGKLNIPLIIDAAHSLLTTYKGKHISHWADYCCFSFQSIKHLTTGDGGAITCLSKENYNKIEKLKWFGLSRKVPKGKTKVQHQMTYSIPEWGYKFHTNDIASAIGLANIEVAKKAVAKSMDNASYYQEFLADIDQVVLLNPSEDSESSWWVYGFLAEERDKLIKTLEKNGIVASQLWKPNSEHSCFFGRNVDVNLDLLKRAIFIPNGFWISEVDRSRVINIIKNFYKGK